MTRRPLRFDAPALRDLEWPCFEVTGARDGPRLCILGGIHGCEYSSIAAVIRVMRGLEPAQLAGSVVAVPIVNLPAFRTRTPFVSPPGPRPSSSRESSTTYECLLMLGSIRARRFRRDARL